ncbi:MAG: UDP-N-acetylmuramoyl-L-alanyl-D-glutamate--2,6-diaminopimelate ligase [Burkholderiales bacterium]|jgi:UDP-N-acetylmuramoyl-L-alanyl-D-glutamate--2,6-diaminopimelate ligase|nr:UDP-N-acetylmuramoyl-L-alanyl-D-glutamate--2,6-diaminopimelate ligase [Burkholderiales bacterium]
MGLLGVIMISRNSLASFSTYTQIINDLGYFLSEYNLEIDSRKVNPDTIFCAYPGTVSDGRKYIESAVALGAKAIIYESGIIPLIPVKNFPVKNLIYYIGLLAAHKYDNPSKKFHTIGVTGTNGKTSVTYWLNQLYTKLEKKIAIIGTTGAGIYPDIISHTVTTPDPISLQKLLYSFVAEKIDLLAMEVSSHALHQGRVNGTTFKTAIFTNLTQDHLDYHKTMEAYYLAKCDLFYWQGLENAIVNIDDEHGERLVMELTQHNSNIKILTYGINHGDLRAHGLVIKLSGMSFKISYKNEEYIANVQVIGRFNVYNILAVVGSLIANGYSLAKIVPLLGELKPVCGRMDTIIQENCPLVVIDYAHTPDALLNTLATLKDIEYSKKLYCVFGCGGDRDWAKRPIMGGIATKMADFTYITSDNPRNEEPEEIIRHIAVGAVNSNYEVIVSREEAINRAIYNAKANDIILIAGKGHETYQDIKGEKIHFSDFEVAKNALDFKLSRG